MRTFEGIWIPLVTPMRGDGAAVDIGALVSLVRHLAAQGVAGFMPCGSTGEAAMLSPDEQEQVLAVTLRAAGGVPVVMGLSGTRPQAVAARARELASRHALAGFLLAPPAYVRPSQAGIADWFTTVADASPVPIVAYDVPARTGVRIEPDTLRALADHPRIRAVKDCSGSRAAAQAILDDGRLALLAGNDDELFDQLARGAAGGVTASAHLATGAFVQLQRRLAAGRLAEARALWRPLVPVTAAAFAEPNPAPVKAALARLGRIDPAIRAPMQAASEATAQRLLHAAAAADAALAGQPEAVEVAG